MHPSGPVVLPALVLSEVQHLAGHALVIAVALGIEQECRLCKALTVPLAKGSMAWSGTGMTGGIGAAVAASSRLGFDMPTMRTAIGIALSQAAGFRAMHGTLCTPLLHACLELRVAQDLDPARIVAVAIAASPGAMALCNNRNPQDEMQAPVSLHQWAAVCLIRGTARIRHMDADTAVKDPAPMAFQDRVGATLDPNRAADSAKVTVTMTDSTQHTARVAHGIGSAARPMTNSALDVKFAGMAFPVLSETRTRSLMHQCWGLADLTDAGALVLAAG